MKIELLLKFLSIITLHPFSEKIERISAEERISNTAIRSVCEGEYHLQRDRPLPLYWDFTLGSQNCDMISAESELKSVSTTLQSTENANKASWKAKLFLIFCIDSDLWVKWD